MKTGILIGGLFLALLVAAIVVVDMVRIPDMYSVKGEATVKYMPDTAKIEASVIQTGDASTDAIQATANGMTNVLNALKTAGIADADIASRAIETHVILPDDDSVERKKLGHMYVAKQTIVVTLHDLSLVSKAAGAISDAGSNQWWVSYSVADEATLKDAVAKAAFEDAIKKADIYAAAGGFKRGRLLKLADSTISFPTLGYDEPNYSSNAGIEEIVVTARRAEEKAIRFTVPKPEEKSIDADVTLLLATH